MVSEVLLSVELVPVSVHDVMSGVPGAESEAESITTTSTGVEDDETLPAVSVCMVVRLYVPSVRAGEGVRVIVPPAQVPEASVVTPSLSVTVAPVSQLAIKSGVVSEVMSSEFELPVSVPDVMFGAPGAPGVVASMVTERFELAVETLPAVSVCVALMVA